MRHIHLLVFVALLHGCENPTVEPPSIVVDVSELAPEAAAAIKTLHGKAISHPDDGTLWRDLGMLYHAHGLEEAAIVMYDFVGHTGNDPQSIYLQAVANARLGAYENAIRLASQVSDYTPAIWRQGQWLMDQGKLDAAASKFQNAISREPSTVAAIVGLARVRIAQDRPEEAIVLLEDIRNRGGNHPYLTFLLGTAHQRAGHQSVASSFLIGTIPGQPKWDDPWSDQMRSMQRGFAASLNRATGMIADGDLQGALTVLLSISKSYPRDPAVHNNLATVYIQLGQHHKAIEILTKSIRWAPKYAPTQLTMALALQRNGNAERAMSYARKAVALQPAMSAAHALLGRLSLQQGDLQSASSYFSESISIGNSDISIREMYAMVLLDLGQSREAMHQFGLVLQISPTRTASIGGIAVATARLGDIQRAVGLIDEARRLIPNDSNLDRAMNTILQMRKDQ